jgi:hypothetical protein
VTASVDMGLRPFEGAALTRASHRLGHRRNGTQSIQHPTGQGIAVNLEIDAAIDQYRGLLEDLAAEEKEMALLLTVSGHADGFTSSIQAADKAIDGLLAQVRSLGAGIDELGLLDGGSGRSDFFAGQLSAAAGSWSSLGQASTNQLKLVRGL